MVGFGLGLTVGTSVGLIVEGADVGVLVGFLEGSEVDGAGL